MSNPLVQMHAKIVSPKGTVTLGPDKRVTVSIDAWGIVIAGGGGPPPPKGGDPFPQLPGGGGPLPQPPRPPGDGSVVIQSNTEVEAGQVLVKLGNADFKQATQLPGSRPRKRWRFTGTISREGNLDVTVRAKPPPGFRGNDGQDDVTFTVVIDDRSPDLEINAPSVNHRFPMPGAKRTITVRGSAADDRSGVSRVLVGIGEASERATLRRGRWSKRLTLKGVGRHTIVARAVDGVGNDRQRRRSVRTIDTGDPVLEITRPEPGAAFEWSDDLMVLVGGTASDEGSGVQSVEWRLADDDEYQEAERRARGWSRWRARVPIPRPGEHTIEFRCFDNADEPNGTRATITIHAQRTFEIEADATSRRAYLKTLLDFATRRLKASENGNVHEVDEQQLNDTFHQPFAQLSRPDTPVRDVATRPVHQVRLSIEALRRFLGEVSASADAGYRQAAYQAMLRNLGTSYDELHLARSEDDATREALAERLGVEPEHLNELTLDADTFDEDDLERLFGLASTRHDPLSGSADPVKQAELLSMRRQHLRSLWQQQDHGEQPAAQALPVILDPDLVSEADLRSADDRTAALWRARRDQVIARLAEIEAARGEATLESFDDLVEQYLGLDLRALLDQREQGFDIRDQLDDANLELSAFLQLVRIRRMLETESALESDWADVFAILVQVQKRRHMDPAWRAEEQAEGLTLSPDYFKLNDAAGQEPELPRWRASREARRGWENTLQARIQQSEAVEQSLRAVVEATEETTLPILRRALLAPLEEAHTNVAVANWLTQRLLIDISNSGSLKTTRLRQAIETIQTMLFSIRSGRFNTLPELGDHDVPPAKWELRPDENYTGTDFDREWEWVGSYNTWRAAMLVFMYPENYLLPSLWAAGTAGQEPTRAFRELVNDLRSPARLSPEEARERAANYLDRVGNEVDLPDALQDIQLTEQRSSEELQRLKGLVKERFDHAIEEGHIGDGEHPHRGAPNYLKEIFFFVPLQIALQLQKADEFLAALDWFRVVYAYHLPPGERKVYYGLVLEEDLENEYHEIDWLQDTLNPHQIVSETSRRASAYTRFTLLSLVRCFLDFADEEFTRETSESIPNARALYITALDLLALKEMHPGSGDEEEASPFPANPVLESLRRHAELNLLKIRSGHNIAGVERQADALLQSGTGAAGAGEAIPQQIAPPPTRYRYTALIERAKQLVGVAQQLEAAFLSAIEKRNQRAYNLLRARQDLELTRATLQLQDLRVSEAESNIALSQLQRESAVLRSHTYQQWIDEGLNRHEREMIASYQEAAAAQKSAENWAFASQAARSLLPYASKDSIGSLFTSATGLVTAGGVAATFLQSRQQKRAIDASTSAQVASVHASFARRKQEWELHKGLARQDSEIGTQQVMLAFTQNQIALQEREIASMQTDHAEAAVDFLSNRFDNVELYEWMSGVLTQVYAYFLQQATAMARLSQRQLAFERQEPSPAHIQADYWRPPSETEIRSAPAVGADRARDRRGLTGSARLLQDIYQLDQYAFETRRRKLQLAQSFSLAQLVPFEFQRFRQTGVLPFATAMELFDRAFPGHYLRLIKRIRVSVIALVPPVEGIRATLVSSGVSRTVTESARRRSAVLPNGAEGVARAAGANEFQQALIRRNPEQIAFTAPIDATGLLELEPEEGLLLPFEGTGVEAAWELRMPRAANRIDFHTIADVLFTVEYTALHSDTYARQVAQKLDRTVSADRPFSFRQQFADAWYNLHNPGQAEIPMTARFTTRQEDFPPNLAGLTIRHVLLYFVRAGGAALEVDVDLQFGTRESEEPAGGPARSIDGIISTRRGNAEAWLSMIGLAPAGTWQLVLTDSDEAGNLFRDEQIEDILLVINYEGQTPAWPR